MAWYEAHQTLAKHPKTLRLAGLLKCERRYAVGLLHDLFSWGLDAARKDGSLPGLSADAIAIALDFTGKKGADVVSALLDSGYLETVDGTFRIHDWYDYAGKFSEQREADKQRKKDAKIKRQKDDSQKNSDGIPAEIPRTDSGNPPVTVPIPKPYHYTRDSVCIARARAGEATQQQTEPDPDRWSEFWAAYPRKSGGDIRQACFEYCRLVDEGVSPETMISAAKELAARTNKDTFRYLPSAEKWLRNKGWTEKYPSGDETKTNNIFLQMLDEEQAK